jgi:hypothetical protein
MGIMERAGEDWSRYRTLLSIKPSRTTLCGSILIKGISLTAQIKPCLTVYSTDRSAPEGNKPIIWDAIIAVQIAIAPWATLSAGRVPPPISTNPKARSLENLPYRNVSGLKKSIVLRNG